MTRLFIQIGFVILIVGCAGKSDEGDSDGSVGTDASAGSSGRANAADSGATSATGGSEAIVADGGGAVTGNGGAGGDCLKQPSIAPPPRSDCWSRETPSPPS